MGDMREDFDALKQYNKKRKAKNLAKANSEGWKVHTAYHWSRTVDGKRLDYWPSTTRFQYDGKVYTGGVEGFIKKKENRHA